MIKLMTIVMVSAVVGGHHHHHHCKHHHKCKVHHVSTIHRAKQPQTNPVPTVVPSNTPSISPVPSQPAESQETEYPNNEVTCEQWNREMQEAKFEQWEIEELSMCNE